MRDRARRRPLPLTSLIDAIFLLLLFFMLSSTFSKLGEIPLQVGTTGPATQSPSQLVFLRLDQDTLSLNGEPTQLPLLATELAGTSEQTVLVSVRPEVSAQRMADLLVALRGVPGLDVLLLGDG